MGEQLLRKRARSRYWYTWVPEIGGGKRLVSTRCTDKSAALKVARDLERRAVNPGYAAAAQTTVRELMSRYVASRTRLGRAPGTMHHVTTKAGHLTRLLPEFCAGVTHAELESYVDKRLAEDVRRTTIKKELRVFGAAWKHGARNRLVSTPLDELMPELEDDYVPRKRALSPAEAYGLCLALPSARAAVVVFAIATGAEWSAIKRALRSDVATDGSRVALHGTKRRSRERVAPLPMPDQRAMVLWALAHGDGPGDKLFSAWTNVRRDLHAACDKLGIPHCSPNDLRRTYGSWLRAKGVEPQLIGAAMGHTDSRMVERVYGRFTPDGLARLLEGAVLDTDRREGVRTVSGGTGNPRPPEGPGGGAKGLKAPENECPETESNCRHGDFQSFESSRENTRNLRFCAHGCPVCVLCAKARGRGKSPPDRARYRILPGGRVEPLTKLARARMAAWSRMRGAA